MSKIVNFEDMLEIANDLGIPAYPEFVDQAEALGSAMAESIATQLGIAHTPAKSVRGPVRDIHAGIRRTGMPDCDR